MGCRMLGQEVLVLSGAGRGIQRKWQLKGVRYALNSTREEKRGGKDFAPRPGPKWTKATCGQRVSLEASAGRGPDAPSKK